MERKKASEYPQELLNLFDRYVHGELDRRGFLEGAKKFAAGGMTATAIWESLRPNYAWAEQVPKDDSRLKTEYLSVPSPQGNGSIRGYFVRPAKTAGKRKDIARFEIHLLAGPFTDPRCLVERSARQVSRDFG